MKRFHIVAATVVACALLAVPVQAKKENPLLRSWNQSLQEAVALLRQQESSRALGITEKLLTEMRKKVFPGEGSAKAFGMALMLHAVAEAGLEREADAAWHWQVAQQMEPALESWDLSEFGPPAEILRRHRLTADPAPSVPAGDLRALGIVPPEKLPGGAMPMPSQATRDLGREELIVLNAVIGADGVPTHPRFVQLPGDLAFALGAAEWMRESRFRPAQLDGKPIAVSYTLTAKFRTA